MLRSIRSCCKLYLTCMELGIPQIQITLSSPVLGVNCVHVCESFRPFLHVLKTSVEKLYGSSVLKGGYHIRSYLCKQINLNTLSVTSCHQILFYYWLIHRSRTTLGTDLHGRYFHMSNFDIRDHMNIGIHLEKKRKLLTTCLDCLI